jgi:4'-phosphopantetheinyl transferase EntD
MARLLDPPIVVREMDPREVSGSLLQEEQAAVARAVHKRVQHFTAGRVCARQGLKALGLGADTAIVAAQDRAPLWPEGFVGSISHTDDWCAAAVARSEQVRAIGIDLENASPLKDELLSHICTEQERGFLRQSENAALLAKVVFSAKEAFYKCQYPLSKQYLGFHDAEVRLGEGRFSASFQKPAGPFSLGDTIVGRFLVEDGLVATACVILQS